MNFIVFQKLFYVCSSLNNMTFFVAKLTIVTRTDQCMFEVTVISNATYIDI